MEDSFRRKFIDYNINECILNKKEYQKKEFKISIKHILFKDTKNALELNKNNSIDDDKIKKNLQPVELCSLKK